MFKVGDKVRCIDNDDLESYITVGKIYTVISTNEDSINICDDIGDHCSYSEIRFELVKEEPTKMKMKFVPMDELEVISVNGVDRILIPE